MAWLPKQRWQNVGREPESAQSQNPQNHNPRETPSNAKAEHPHTFDRTLNGMASSPPTVPRMGEPCLAVHCRALPCLSGTMWVLAAPLVAPLLVLAALLLRSACRSDSLATALCAPALCSGAV